MPVNFVSNAIGYAVFVPITAEISARIQEIAVGQLGMIIPEVVYLGDKEVVTQKAVKQGMPGNYWQRPVGMGRQD